MKKLLLFLLLIGLISCGPILHNLYKVQSDKRIRKTESKNFITDKAATQWWYFDFNFDDGSVLFLIFVPHDWWSYSENLEEGKTLIYASYMKPNGEVIKAEKIIDSKEIHYYENGLKCSYLEILKDHCKSGREYTINLNFENFKGTATIDSDQKSYSPLPRGSMGKFGTRHILRKGKGTSYRYSAHVPQGVTHSTLIIEDETRHLSGKAYHEQGWFKGQAHEMGDGWVWFHFTSDRINLFGARSFFYLEMNDKIIFRRLTLADKGAIFSDSIFAETPSNFLHGGSLSFTSSKISFDVVPVGVECSPMACIVSDKSQQVWGTVVQRSQIQITHKGESLTEKGNLFIETCMMKQ